MIGVSLSIYRWPAITPSEPRFVREVTLGLEVIPREGEFITLHEGEGEDAQGADSVTTVKVVGVQHVIVPPSKQVVLLTCSEQK